MQAALATFANYREQLGNVWANFLGSLGHFYFSHLFTLTNIDLFYAKFKNASDEIIIYCSDNLVKILYHNDQLKIKTFANILSWLSWLTSCFTSMDSDTLLSWINDRFISLVKSKPVKREVSHTYSDTSPTKASEYCLHQQFAPYDSNWFLWYILSDQ